MLEKTMEMVSPTRIDKSKGQQEDSWTSSKRKRLQEARETPLPEKNKMLDENLVGSRIKVWWPGDEKFYAGVVKSFDASSKRHKVLYDDGDVEVLALKKERWKFIAEEQDTDPDAASALRLLSLQHHLELGKVNLHRLGIQKVHKKLLYDHGRDEEDEIAIVERSQPKKDEKEGKRPKKDEKEGKRPKKGERIEDMMGRYLDMMGEYLHMMGRYLDMRTYQVQDESADLAKEKEAAVSEFSITRCISILSTLEVTKEEKAKAFQVFIKSKEHREAFLSGCELDKDATLIWLRSVMV